MVRSSLFLLFLSVFHHLAWDHGKTKLCLVRLGSNHTGMALHPPNILCSLFFSDFQTLALPAGDGSLLVFGLSPEHQGCSLGFALVEFPVTSGWRTISFVLRVNPFFVHHQTQDLMVNVRMQQTKHGPFWIVHLRLCPC